MTYPQREIYAMRGDLVYLNFKVFNKQCNDLIAKCLGITHIRAFSSY